MAGQLAALHSSKRAEQSAKIPSKHAQILVLASGGRGQGFESLRARHPCNILKCQWVKKLSGMGTVIANRHTP